ncbi:MAG TPA: hypothetical protein EYQ14_26000 [Gammaproteobacteria bacterium]|nr:hypothetical protein [Gammaproteobacteria bacterium]
MELTEKQRLYQSHIASAESADTPLTVYAREHGINVQCLYSEKNRLRKYEQKGLSGFVRVEDVSRESINPALLQIRLPNGVSLALPTQQVSLDQMLQTLVQL